MWSRERALLTEPGSGADRGNGATSLRLIGLRHPWGICVAHVRDSESVGGGGRGGESGESARARNVTSKVAPLRPEGALRLEDCPRSQWTWGGTTQYVRNRPAARVRPEASLPRWTAAAPPPPPEGCWWSGKRLRGNIRRLQNRRDRCRRTHVTPKAGVKRMPFGGGPAVAAVGLAVGPTRTHISPSGCRAPSHDTGLQVPCTSGMQQQHVGACCMSSGLCYCVLW